MVHASAWDPTHRFPAWLGCFAYAAVDWFFVLSGFVIVTVHYDEFGDRRHLRRYAAKRFTRVYPAYWVYYLLAIALLTARGITFYHPGLHREIIWAVLLVPAANNYLPQAWTLPYEMMFYFAVGVAMLCPRRVVPWIALGWTAAVAAVAAVRGGRPDDRFTLAVSPLVIEFLAGCGLAVLIRQGRRGLPPATLGLAAIWFVGAAILNYLGVLHGASDVRQRVLCFGVPCSLGVYGLIGLEAEGHFRAPRFLRLLGDASYSLYLTHVTVFWLIDPARRGASGGMLAAVAWTLTQTAVATVVGCLCYLAVERPLLRHCRDRFVRKSLTEPAILRVPDRRKAA
jgi:peptidoglycan/LPS O-acetylase OafA/YrhL